MAAGVYEADPDHPAGRLFPAVYLTCATNGYRSMYGFAGLTPIRPCSENLVFCEKGM
jgi:hypothetical protein